MHAVGIVAAAGSGPGFGADRPEALAPLAGRPLVCWAVEGLLTAGVAEVVVAAPAGERAPFAAALGPGVTLVEGGLRAALAAVGDEADAVLVHDAARPLTPPDVVARVLAALADGARAVVPVLPVVDTTVVVDDDGAVVDGMPRAHLRRLQSPQGFDRATLAAACARPADGREPRDAAAAVRELGVEITTVAGDDRANRVTLPHEIALAELQVRR